MGQKVAFVGESGCGTRGCHRDKIKGYKGVL